MQSVLSIWIATANQNNPSARTLQGAGFLGVSRSLTTNNQPIKNMTEKNESFIRYVVVTSHGFWGRSPDLLKALENARVKSFYNLNTKKDETHVARVYRIELDPVESRWTDETKAELKRCRMILRGYEVGDLIEPWVNDWGSVTSWGTGKEPELVIELKIK